MSKISAEDCQKFYKKFMEFYGEFEVAASREAGASVNSIESNRIHNAIGCFVAGMEIENDERVDPNALLRGLAHAFAHFLTDLEDDCRGHAVSNFLTVVEDRVNQTTKKPH